MMLRVSLTVYIGKSDLSSLIAAGTAGNEQRLIISRRVAQIAADDGAEIVYSFFADLCRKSTRY